MTDLLKNPENHISKWIEISVLQNVSISLGFEGDPNEYSTVGGDALLQAVNSLGADPTTTIQPSMPSTMANTSTAPPPETLAFTVTLVVGMLVTLSVCIIGSIGNLLTIAALVYQFRLPACKRYVSRLSADTILILNLCVADFCYSAISLPFMFVIYMTLYFHAEEALVGGYAVFRCWTCKWAAFLRYTNAITEWTTLGIMALERCVTIYRFQRKLRPVRFFSPVKTLSYVISLWVFAIAAQTLTLTEHFGSFGYNQDTLKCDFMPSGNETYFVTPRVFFFALESAVPCFLILIGYVVILTQVYSSKSFFTGNNSITSTTLMSMCLRRSKTTRLIMLLLTLYIVCIIPVCIYNLVIHERELGEPKNQIIGIAFYCLYWLQYAANNFIYVVSNEKFRNMYKQFFSMLLCRDIPSPSTAKYLKLQSDRACRIQTIMTTRQHHKMRMRTPSEMTIDGLARRDSYVNPQSHISILAININIATLKNGPILVLPEAHLTNYYSGDKTDVVISYEKDKFSSLDPSCCFKDDFKFYKRPASLHRSENKPSLNRRRSLSV